ncbi:hypothetical protein [Sulfitobacter sp. MF3-043]|uniref:hypothetical protein n=1 Tax=Sulfitobacter sediminivivens TaxID=3252902 RepID=UPI0036DD1E99
MANLTDNQLKTIKRFVSHPSGLGYVLNYSNNSFSSWFRDNWNVNIDWEEYTNGELSKGDRLLSFCAKADVDLVSSVLRRLYDEAIELDIETSEQVTVQTVRSFQQILLTLEAQATIKGNTSQPKGFSKETVLRNVKNSRPSIILVVSGTIERLAEFREVVRADNALGATQPETKDRLLKLLDALSVHLENLLKLVPMIDQEVSGEQGSQIVKWTDQYVNAALPKLQEYVSPEALGRTSVPAGLILLCGGIGSLLTGFSPIGFGAGSIVGKMLVGEMKSGAAADELQDRFSGEK